MAEKRWDQLKKCYKEIFQFEKSELKLFKLRSKIDFVSYPVCVERLCIYIYICIYMYVYVYMNTDNIILLLSFAL